MTKVCEIENLVPFECIKNISYFKAHILVTDIKGFDYSFFDMKDGVHYRYMYSDEGYKHWSSQLSHLADSKVLRTIDSDRRSMTEEDFCKQHKGKRLCDAFGTKILSQCLTQMKSEKRIYTDDDLSLDQQYEWENIGRIITSWCCCYAKQIL